MNLAGRDSSEGDTGRTASPKEKAWGGRFTKLPDQKVQAFTASIGFDWRLYREDIEGSIAHGEMLVRQGIIAPYEGKSIIEGLREIRAEIDSGQFVFREEHEDIHLNIEKRLIEKIGPAGGKLHTARSRNDQVALDERIYLLRQIDEVVVGIVRLEEELLLRAKENLEVIMPGYTHLQHAQPVLFSHHLMAYFWMLERDVERFLDTKKRTLVSPLGAGALAGTTFNIDPYYSAEKLGFKGVFKNSIDAVSDRDHLLEFLSAAAICMMHLSRLCEELVLWSTAEFGYVEMDDSYATGSSMMPQKKNPDVAELVRGKTGRVYGDLMSLLCVMKGLPLAYHSDMQEDKERVFDAVDTLKACLDACAGMLRTMTVRRERMAAALAAGHCNATEVADYLARKGIPFRQAHHITGNVVKYCIEKGIPIQELTLDELRKFSEEFSDDIYGSLSPEACVNRRRSPGGTAPERVVEQISLAEKLLESRQREKNNRAYL
ncbi:MAG: argininosuccinate lyase [Candidatus Fermentithermobacillus carboniphilus]|uniref:Argininosuccinate lyase n=1 Tax=Candidatus Fermentithermobacillus carboniphilus TaxID=3085328 RepID=A0AAT9LG24_9FIRM|nr:MAG: argininosuccinate lyase [Candidatus Fermentithermobacillus carboniphilus]